MKNVNNSYLSSKTHTSSSLILGGSRGLGRAIFNLMGGTICSRTQGEFMDLSKPSSIIKILKLVKRCSPSQIFYCAGGGPHGDFDSKPLQSHKWAFQVNQFTPLSLILSLREIGYKGEFIYIGSAIAERSTSLKSLSYSFSKKVMKKALLNFNGDELRIRVFSPPYMDTGLLPQKSWPRLECAELVLDPKDVAATLLDWISGESSKEWGLKERHFDWMERFDYVIPKEKEI